MSKSQTQPRSLRRKGVNKSVTDSTKNIDDYLRIISQLLWILTDLFYVCGTFPIHKASKEVNN